MSKNSTPERVPCPDGKPGCLVLHYKGVNSTPEKCWRCDGWGLVGRSSRKCSTCNSTGLVPQNPLEITKKKVNGVDGYYGDDQPVLEPQDESTGKPAPYVNNWDYPTDLLEAAWGLIANNYGGDWDKATPEWKQAAEEWRDAYLATLPPLTYEYWLDGVKLKERAPEANTEEHDTIVEVISGAIHEFHNREGVVVINDITSRAAAEIETLLATARREGAIEELEKLLASHIQTCGAANFEGELDDCNLESLVIRKLAELKGTEECAPTELFEMCECGHKEWLHKPECERCTVCYAFVQALAALSPQKRPRKKGGHDAK